MFFKKSVKFWCGYLCVCVRESNHVHTTFQAHTSRRLSEPLSRSWIRVNVEKLSQIASVSQVVRDGQTVYASKCQVISGVYLILFFFKLPTVSQFTAETPVFCSHSVCICDALLPHHMTVHHCIHFTFLCWTCSVCWIKNDLKTLQLFGLFSY